MTALSLNSWDHVVCIVVSGKIGLGQYLPIRSSDSTAEPTKVLGSGIPIRYNTDSPSEHHAWMASSWLD
jgi:hypothetical protein